MVHYVHVVKGPSVCVNHIFAIAIAITIAITIAIANFFLILYIYFLIYFSFGKMLVVELVSD